MVEKEITNEDVIDEPVIEKFEGEQVRVNGVLVNIIATLLLFPTAWGVITIKYSWLNESYDYKDYNEWVTGLIVFLVVFIIGMLVHELIKYVTFKGMGIKHVRLRLKDFIFFLYSKEELTIKQARVLWLTPFLICAGLAVIGLFVFKVYIALALAFSVVVTCDGFIMFIHLMKSDSEGIYIQEKDFLGYTCRKK